MARRALDRVRQYVARSLGEVDDSATALLWVTDFPMFEWCAAKMQNIQHASGSLRRPYLELGGGAFPTD